MANIDNTPPMTFSQPMSTADEVAQGILDLCGNNQRELAMPRSSGFLATLGYLLPWLHRALWPYLERKGQRVKDALKAEARAKAKAEAAKESDPN